MFVPVSVEDGVLAVNGASWFLELLGHVPGLILDGGPVQEDWGVLVPVRSDRRFWIGLAGMDEGEWIAHVVHRSWFQKLGSSREQSRGQVIRELDRALHAAHASQIAWFEEKDLLLQDAAESP